MPSRPQPEDTDPFTILALLRDYIRKDEHERQIKEMEDDMQKLETRVDKDSGAIHDDLKSLRQELKNVQEAIINKQVESRNRIIRIQAMLLSPVVIAVIVYIVQSFLPK